MNGLFDVDLLDDDDPFEIDDFNLPHLYSHATQTGIPLGPDDIYDLWTADLLFYEATAVGDAEWLMVGIVPGNITLCVPLAPPMSGDVSKCRPIGVYEASVDLKIQYLADRG